MHSDDAEFLARFEAASVSRAEWTHAAHIRMAFAMVRREFANRCDAREPCRAKELVDALLPRVRTGILRLNERNGVANTPDGGYHETITVAWLRLVASAVLARGATADFESFARDHPHLLVPTLLRVFYSPEGMPPHARGTFVAPDILALPA